MSHRNLDVESSDDEAPALVNHDTFMEKFLQSKTLELMDIPKLEPMLMEKATKHVADLLLVKQDMDSMVSKLNSQQLTTLLLFVYKAMNLQYSSAQCQVFLSWQQAILKKEGVGAVMRVLCQ